MKEKQNEKAKEKEKEEDCDILYDCYRILGSFSTFQLV